MAYSHQQTTKLKGILSHTWRAWEWQCFSEISEDSGSQESSCSSDCQRLRGHSMLRCISKSCVQLPLLVSLIKACEVANDGVYSTRWFHAGTGSSMRLSL